MEPWLHLAMQTGVLMVVIYLRVSTEEQALKGKSLPEQRRACIARAEQIAREHGLQMQVREFEDHGPGEILNRPVLNLVRDHIRTQPVHLFVCLDPDRFARKLFLQLLVTEEIERRRIRLEFVQHNYQATDEGRLFYQIRGAISEFEKSKIAERMRRGKLGSLREGKIPHNLRVYGYRYVVGAGTLEADPQEATWLRQMFGWVTEEQLGPLRVAERLNELGVAAPKGNWWYRSVVYRLLRNPIYTGRLELNRADWSGVRFNRFRARDELLRPAEKPVEDWIEVEVPQIITREMWEDAQRILGTVRRRKAGVGSRLHLLSGMCRCGRCGGPVHYVTSKNRVGKVYRWLRCPNRDPRITGADPARRPVHRCELPHVRADEVDAWMKQTIESWFEDPKLLRARLESAHRNKGQAKRPAAAEMELLRAQLATLDQEQDRLLDMAQRGLVPAGKLDGRLADIMQKAAALQARIAHLARLAGPDLPSPDAVVTTLERVRDEVRQRLHDQGQEEWQQLIRSLIRQVVISGTDPSDWDIEF